MTNLLNNIQKTLLMGPGPSTVPDEIYAALARPTIGHLDPYFIKIMDELKEQLQTLLCSKNRLTMPMSGTGSAGMETCFVNLVEPGDKVLTIINGVFGMRMQDVASRLGAAVDVLEFEWGTPVLVDAVKEKLESESYKIVAVVHAETSTGVKNPVSEIGKIVKESGALFLVDAVTSLGGIPVKADEWGIDALYSGSQKCLSCPPGLAPLTFSQKAVDALQGRKNKVPNWYLDLTLITAYWEGSSRTYHHTAPINMIYGLHQALDMVLEEGMDNVFIRHENVHRQLVKGLEDMGLSMLVDPEYRLPMLNSVLIPKGVDEVKIRQALMNTYQIEVGAGLGSLAGKIWRIGLMGHTAREKNVTRLLTALKKEL